MEVDTDSSATYTDFTGSTGDGSSCGSSEEFVMVSDDPSRKSDQHEPPRIKMVNETRNKDETTNAGLLNVRALWFLFLWYFFSGCTLFLNKYILTYMEGDSILLGCVQMFMTMACGYIQILYPCGMYKKVTRLKNTSRVLQTHDHCGGYEVFHRVVRSYCSKLCGCEFH